MHQGVNTPAFDHELSFKSILIATVVNRGKKYSIINLCHVTTFNISTFKIGQCEISNIASVSCVHLAALERQLKQ